MTSSMSCINIWSCSWVFVLTNETVQKEAHGGKEPSHSGGARCGVAASPHGKEPEEVIQDVLGRPESMSQLAWEHLSTPEEIA